MAYSNSSMVSFTLISPNRYRNRGHAIDRISIHCVVGQCSVESLGYLFAQRSKEASSNYGIGYDGRVGLYVEECDHSWCTSSFENDDRAVTIETASDTYAPYRVTDAAYKTLLDLCTDICRRNGKKKLLWLGTKEATLAYQPKSDEMLLSVHRWWANKACPGEYLFQRHGKIAEEVTKRLSGSAPVNGNEVCNVTLPVLHRGMDSGYVRTAQILLNKYNNAGLAEDGGFGPATERAVIAYQRSRGLAADGWIGAQTWSQLLC